ncbi:MAG: DUF1616 domain-containing protein [Candidatus Natronoplasma sp.]
MKVKVKIKEKPWDLALIAAMTALLIAVIAGMPESTLRTVLGLPFILFFPGYVLISFLFPEKEPLDHIERIALSFGLSIAITPLIGLLLNYVWEISLIPILYSQSLFIFTFSFLTHFRRKAIPSEEQFSIEFDIETPDWKSYDIIDKALVIATVVLLIASGALAYNIATTPRTGERFTEFYVLGPDGKADNYPTNLTLNQNGTVIVGAVNREHTTVNYTLVVGLGYSYGEMARVGEIPPDHNFTLPSNNTCFEMPLTLKHGERWNQTINFFIGEPGRDYKLSFLLLRDGEVYRDLHLWVDVLESTEG